MSQQFNDEERAAPAADQSSTEEEHDEEEQDEEDGSHDGQEKADSKSSMKDGRENKNTSVDGEDVGAADGAAGKSAPTSKFVCAVCLKTFGTKGSLKTHNRVHTGEKPFVCPVPGCGRSFSQHPNCVRHVKLLHTGADADAARSNKKQALLANKRARYGPDGMDGGTGIDRRDLAVPQMYDHVMIPGGIPSTSPLYAYPHMMAPPQYVMQGTSPYIYASPQVYSAPGSGFAQMIQPTAMAQAIAPRMSTMNVQTAPRGVTQIVPASHMFAPTYIFSPSSVPPQAHIPSRGVIMDGAAMFSHQYGYDPSTTAVDGQYPPQQTNLEGNNNGKATSVPLPQGITDALLSAVARAPDRSRPPQ